MDSSFFQEIRFLISDLFLTFEKLFCYESFFSKFCQKINFRSKPYGWHEFNITFIAGDTSYHSPRKKDPFHEMFFKKNALNEACYACKLRSTIAYTDIRIGDFWGKEYSQNIEGVSAVVINTDKGKVF